MSTQFLKIEEVPKVFALKGRAGDIATTTPRYLHWYDGKWRPCHPQDGTCWYCLRGDRLMVRYEIQIEHEGQSMVLSVGREVYEELLSGDPDPGTPLVIWKSDRGPWTRYHVKPVMVR